VSEQISTIRLYSAIHVGLLWKLFRTENKLKIQTIHKLNTTHKSKQSKTQQNKTGLV